MTNWRWVVLWGVAACNVELPDPRNCDVRTPYWPDADGDGVGDAGSVYLGCSAPEGWVDVPPPADTDTGDTDTGDTDTGDTDTGDTDTGTDSDSSG